MSRRRRHKQLQGAYKLGEFHGRRGLPWIAPEHWDEERQDHYTRGYGVGYDATTTPMAEAELALAAESRWRIIQLIAYGIVWEREHPRHSHAKEAS